MIDKYLRNDRKFLLRKKEEDDIEKEYIKYLQRDFEPDNKKEDDSIDRDPEICSERNYLMRDEEDNNKVDMISRTTPKELPASKSKRVFFNEINELNDDDIFSERKFEDDNDYAQQGHNLESEYLDYENIYLNEGKIKKNIGGLDSDAIQYESNRAITFKKEEEITRESLKLNRKSPSLLTSKQEIEENLDNPSFINKSLSNPRNDTEIIRRSTIDYPNLESRENLQNKSAHVLQENDTKDNYDEFEAIKSYEKNDFKLKRLQEKMEEKLKQEYELMIRKREKEIEMKTKTEFEEAMKDLKDQLQRNLEGEKKKLEDDLHKKWEDKYQDLLVDCKAKLRDDKEQKLAANMYNKLRPVVEKEVYRKEYNKIEVKIRNELEDKFNKEIQTKKFEEIEKAKRKLEFYTKQKITEIESNLKNKCKEEVETELKKDIERKEKEIKINYMKKFNNFKLNLEKQLKEEYDTKKKELLKEINEIKSEVFRQKCAEKLKLSKINNIKKSLVDKEMTQFKNAEKLEKAMQSHYHSQNNLGNSKSFYSDKIVKNNKYVNNQDYLCEADSFNDMAVNNEINLKKKFANLNIATINRSIDRTADGDFDRKPRGMMNEAQSQDGRHIKYPNEMSRSKSRGKASPDENSLMQGNNAVNIFQLNKKFKSPLNLNNSDMMVAQLENKAELSLIIKDLNNTNNLNLKESLKNIVTLNSKISLPKDEHRQEETRSRIILKNDTKYRIESPQRLSDINENNEGNMIVNSQNFMKTADNMNTINNTLNLSPSSRFIKNINASKNTQFAGNPLLINCISIRVSDKIPLTLIEFGKYLVKHIENEENYKILFEKEYKKIKAIIQKIFLKENLSDHCLLDYMLELWDKLEISNEKRYRIMNELAKKYIYLKLLISKANEAYLFLDKETEHLTSYFQSTKEAYQLITNREKLKIRMQSKANKSIFNFNLIFVDELTIDDKQKFKMLTLQVEKMIKLIKEKYNFYIVWKGLQYEWLINYENWFYDQSK